MTLPDQARAMAERLRDYSVVPAHEVAALLVTMAEAMEWRPIETAPKDGMFLAGWADGSGRSCVMAADIYHAQKGRQYTPPHLRFECTHWMPLPAPPASDEGEKG
jgi:hypothetical protein